MPIDELREARRRPATEVELDVERYAKMLAETGNKKCGNYAAKPRRRRKFILSLA